MLDNAPAGDFPSDEDVLRDAEIWKEFELLKNDPNPGLRGFACRLEFHGGSVEENASRGGSVYPRQNFHQRRLARSIFADENIDRTLIDREVDRIQRERAWITLGNLFSGDYDLVAI